MINSCGIICHAVPYGNQKLLINSDVSKFLTELIKPINQTHIAHYWTTDYYDNNDTHYQENTIIDEIVKQIRKESDSHMTSMYGINLLPDNIEIADQLHKKAFQNRVTLLSRKKEDNKLTNTDIIEMHNAIIGKCDMLIVITSDDIQLNKAVAPCLETYKELCHPDMKLLCHINTSLNDNNWIIKSKHLIESEA